MVGHQTWNTPEYLQARAPKRREALSGLVFGVLTVLVVAAASNVPLEEWWASSTAVISAHTVDAINSTLFSGILAGAFFGFYAAKRIVERRKRRKKLLTEVALSREHWARRA
jgi:hypothetical protein